jgi:hypothetical protein
VRSLTFARTRDAVLLIGGLGVLAHEMILVAEPRAILIGLAAAMFGLPMTFLADRKFMSAEKTPDPLPAPEPKGDTP